MLLYIFDGKELDAYGVLGISLGASDGEIKRAYRKLSALYHPDKHIDREEWAKKKMQVVNEAYEEITKRRKGTYIASNAKYRGDDGSRPDLTGNNSKKITTNKVNTEKQTTTKPNNVSTNNGNNKHGGTFGDDNINENDSSDYYKHCYFGNLEDCINNRCKFYSNLCEKLVEKSRNMFPKTPELEKLNKLIDIFSEQKNIYYSFYERFNSTRDINILMGLEKEFNEFNREVSCIKNLYKYLDDEMKPIKSAISLDFSSIYCPEYVDIVVRCIFLGAYFECLIKENIERYIKCCRKEQYAYVYDIIAKEFDYYLLQNDYKLKDIGFFKSCVQLYD